MNSTRPCRDKTQSMLKTESSALLAGLAWVLAFGCGRSGLNPGRDGSVWDPARGRPGDGASGDVKRASGGGGRGAAGAPQIPCLPDAPEPFFTCGYGCGSCESDVVYPLVCRNGFMACPISFVDDKGLSVTVPAGMYVLILDDCETRTGQCSDGEGPADTGVAGREGAGFRSFPSRLRQAGCEPPGQAPATGPEVAPR